MKQVLVCLAAGALALTAQPQPHPQAVVEHDVVVRHGGPGIPPPGATMMFERMMLAPVKGAPFSAESITESVQTLGDGNRISSKQTGKSYRDGEGRTRMEHELSAIGPWTPGEGFTMIAIDDPVAKVHIMLNTKTKTATRMKIPGAGSPGHMTFFQRATPAPGQALEIRVEQRVDTKEAGQEKAKAKAKQTMVMSGPGTMMWESKEGGMHMMGAHAANFSTRTENLGKQTMEGVEVEGTRETMTIPAGELGNERAIDVVTETWRSAALRSDILRRHSDPRFGTNTYRMTAINRAEPARSLFEIPADYKVDEAKTGGVRVMQQKMEGPRKQAREEIF
jgi:hypothetical protein